MRRRPPRYTHTDKFLPYTTLCRYSLEGKIRVSLVATGNDGTGEQAAPTPAARSFSFAPRPAAPAPVAEESIEPEVQEVPFAATETEAAPVAEDRDPAPGFSLNDTAEAEVAAAEEPRELSQDRKSVVRGKRVSERVDMGVS